MVDIIGAHIEIVEGAGGPKAHIAGSRIRVQDVAVWYHQMGMSADEIVQNYPTINRAEVFAALAYYWDNREEIERQVADSNAAEDEFLRRNPGRLTERLARLRAG